MANDNLPAGIYVPGVARGIRPRSTYTAKNAFRWKPLFDSLITSPKNKLVAYETDVSATTQRTRMTDALLWLVDNYSEEYRSANKDIITQDQYAALRGKTKFAIETDGIHIKFNAQGSSSKPLPEIRDASVSSHEQKVWKDKLQEFLMDGEQTFLHLNNIMLKEEEMQWAIDLLKQTGFEASVKSTSITISK